MSKYQKIPEFVEAFQMSEETQRNIKSWPEWAISAGSKDSRQVGSIFFTSPDAPEGSYSIRTIYGEFEIPVGHWVIRLSDESLMLMRDDHFQAGFILADGNAPKVEAKVVAVEQKKPEATIAK
jgi:hypothetical protein